jgi:transcriptional regulator with XRE-family HTH domain
MIKTNKTPSEVELQVVAKLIELRKIFGWTYEETAERMRGEGCNLHPSSIQKTEKSGRRVTVDELVGYSRIFNVAVSDLVGEDPLYFDGANKQYAAKIEVMASDLIEVLRKLR